MWCDNLPRLWGKLSRITFPYKVVINNHSVTIKGNPILFNCSQGFTQNFGISQPSYILNAKNTKTLKQNVRQLVPVYRIHFFINYFKLPTFQIITSILICFTLNKAQLSWQVPRGGNFHKPFVLFI